MKSVVSHSLIFLALAAKFALASPTVVDPSYSLRLVTSSLGITASGAGYLAGTGLVAVNTNASIVDLVNPATGSVTPVNAYGYSIATGTDGLIYGTSNFSNGHSGIKAYDQTGAVQHFYSMSSGCTAPCPIYVNSSGDVFATLDDVSNNTTIYRFSAGTYSNPSVYARGLNNSTTIGGDASGNIYASSGGLVYRIQPGSTSAAQDTLVASGFNGIRELVWNPASSELLVLAGAVYSVNTSSGSTRMLASGFNLALGMTVDSAGNIFVSDQIGGLGQQTGGNLYELSSVATPEPPGVLLSLTGLLVGVVAGFRRRTRTCFAQFRGVLMGH